VGPDGLIGDVLNEVYANAARPHVIKIPRPYGVKWNLPPVVFELNQQHGLLVVCVAGASHTNTARPVVIRVPHDVRDSLVNGKADAICPSSINPCSMAPCIDCGTNDAKKAWPRIEVEYKVCVIVWRVWHGFGVDHTEMKPMATRGPCTGLVHRSTAAVKGG
jgi:hypothetical protein